MCESLNSCIWRSRSSSIFVEVKVTVFILGNVPHYSANSKFTSNFFLKWKLNSSEGLQHVSVRIFFILQQLSEVKARIKNVYPLTSLKSWRFPPSLISQLSVLVSPPSPPLEPPLPSRTRAHEHPPPISQISSSCRLCKVHVLPYLASLATRSFLASIDFPRSEYSW